MVERRRDSLGPHLYGCAVIVRPGLVRQGVGFAVAIQRIDQILPTLALVTVVGCGGAVRDYAVPDRTAAFNEGMRAEEQALLRFEPALNQHWNYLIGIEMSGLTPTPMVLESRVTQRVARVGQGEFEIVSSCRSMTSLSPGRQDIPCTADEVQILDGQAQPQGNAQQQMQTMLVYADEPVGVGSRWHDVLRYQTTEDGVRTDFEISADYLLERFEGEGSERVAIVHLDGTLQTQDQGGAVGTGHVEGDFGVRVRDGVPLSMELVMAVAAKDKQHRQAGRSCEPYATQSDETW